MTILFAIIGTLFVLTILYVVFSNIYGIFKVFFDFFVGEHSNKYWLTKKLNPAYAEVLNEKFGYYKKLSPENQRIFRRRLQKFIDQKKFEAKGGLTDVTAEMKTLIGASAIQLTFGLPRIYLEHFSNIYIYPEAYHSTITGRYHNGEVNSKGIIVLSWENFIHGYHIHNDGRNLGLHEMAHALKIEDSISNREYDFLERSTLLRFIGQTRFETIKINKGEPSFFREYAATNDHEFFAVVIENFFERPAKFKEYHHRLYSLTTRLLRQDPLALPTKKI